MILVLLGLVCLAGPASGAARAPGEPAPMTVAQVPAVVYTSVQGRVLDAPASAGEVRPDYRSWLFHLVLRSAGEPLRIESATLAWLDGGRVSWSRHYPRSYLQELTWLEGGLEYSTAYFLDNIEFVDNSMHSIERRTTPDVPAGGAVTWARIQEAQPPFARADALRVTFEVSASGGDAEEVVHQLPLVEPSQATVLRLPFAGLWFTNAGNDLASGHRRTGLNGVTTYAWDFMKVGEDGRLFRTDGQTPEDFYAYDAPVLAPAAGTVVHVRNDIPDYGIGVTPPRERLEADGDVFAGNLVVIDHGHGEYTLTSHMRAGTIPVSEGDRVAPGELIGRVGNSGASMVPHIHVHMMDGPDWLEARGVPAVFTRFTRVRDYGPDEPVALGNPMTGWLLRAGRQEAAGRGHSPPLSASDS